MRNGPVLKDIKQIFGPNGQLLLDQSGLPGWMTQGNRFFVRPGTGNDKYDGLSPASAFKTLAKAKSKMASNQNDLVFFMAEGNSASATTDYQGEAFNWNLDLAHIVAVGANPFIGQRARIAQLSTVKTVEDLFTVSGNNCLIHGLGIFQGVASSTATSPRAFVVTGQHNVISGCQLSGNGDAAGSTDTAGARSLAVTGAENRLVDCYIGLDTVIRATQEEEVDVANARNILENCIIISYTSNTAFLGLKTLASTTGRDVYLIDTSIHASGNISSAVAPDAAINHAVAGRVYLKGKSGVFGYTNVCAADNANVLVSAPAGGQVDMGLATAVDVA